MATRFYSAKKAIDIADINDAKVYNLETSWLSEFAYQFRAMLDDEGEELGIVSRLCTDICGDPQYEVICVAKYKVAMEIAAILNEKTASLIKKKHPQFAEALQGIKDIRNVLNPLQEQVTTMYGRQRSLDLRVNSLEKWRETSLLDEEKKHDDSIDDMLGRK